jgi:hypothetical protein
MTTTPPLDSGVLLAAETVWGKEERMIPVRELRFVLVSDDFEAAAHLFREILGLEVLLDLDAQTGRCVVLKVPAATLELVDADHERMVDQPEVGRSLDHRVRIAVRVDELIDASREVIATGAEAMAASSRDSLGDRNQRLRAKDGMQLTLFESR